jgi:predicted flap endonuclease-1-like 5' DNA nuclease
MDSQSFPKGRKLFKRFHRINERVKTMRLDYTLYVLAVVFFLITVISFVMVAEQSGRNLWVITTAVLGLFSIGLGYYERPKAKTVAVPEPAVPAVTEDANAKEAHRAEGVEKAVETPIVPVSATPSPMPVVVPTPVLTPAPPEAPATPTIDLTEVKGIGEKRAAQLKALGISNIDELTKASAEDIAAKLKISPKIVEKWITGAKELKK